MNISYDAPLRQSWSRMVRMLFRPFRFDFWLTLGFAAFLSEGLAHLIGGSGGGGGRFQPTGHGVPPILHAARAAAVFMLHPVWGAVLIAILICAATAALLVMWVCSRGKFVFLDGVVRERAAIVEPWKRFTRQGNALFAFWLGLWIVSACAVIAISLPLLPAVLDAIAGGDSWQAVLAIAAMWWVAAMVPLGLVIAYTNLFLFQFVVPIMYKDGVGVFEGWRRFLALFRAHPLQFVVFGIFFLFAMILTVTAIVVAGFSTCCIGFLLMAIPYVSSVVLLPVDVLFRGLGPDFLAQFGPQWTITGAPAEPPPPGARA